MGGGAWDLEEGCFVVAVALTPQGRVLTVSSPVVVVNKTPQALKVRGAPRVACSQLFDRNCWWICPNVYSISCCLNRCLNL